MCNMLEIKITNEPVKLSDFLLTANPFIEKGFPVRRKSESFRGSIVIVLRVPAWALWV